MAELSLLGWVRGLCSSPLPVLDCSLWEGEAATLPRQLLQVPFCSWGPFCIPAKALEPHLDELPCHCSG